MSAETQRESVNKVIVDTGNILVNDDIRGKIYNTSTDELIGSVSWTLKNAVTNVPSDSTNHTERLQLTSRFKSKAKYVNETTKINCKLFSFDNTSCCVLHEAVNAVFRSLECNQIDQLIVCPSFEEKIKREQNDDTNQIVHPGIMKVWKCAEKMVNEDKVKSLGVSDFDLAPLQYLLAHSQIKPSLNQISNHLCCSIPAELSNFASEKSIHLLTHNDKKVLLDTSDLKVLCSYLERYLEENYSISTSLPATVEWIIRYTVQTTSTAVVDIKGYIVSFKRKVVSHASKQQSASDEAPSWLALQRERGVFVRTLSKRSLGDVMEKVKNKIFGSRKQSNSNSANNQQQVNQMSASGSQYNPYASLQGYNWGTLPASSLYKQGNGYNPTMPQYSPSSMLGASFDTSSLSALTNGMSQNSPINSPSQQSQHSGLLSSASQLISQYLSPSASSGTASSGSNGGQSFMSGYNYGTPQSAQSQVAQSSQGSQGQQAPAISSSYNDFSQMLDSMVAASGVGQRGQPSIQQFLSPSVPSGNSMSLSTGGLMTADHDMSSSNMVPTYMSSTSSQGAQQSSGPSAVGVLPQQQQAAAIANNQQAQQKSSMVSLAEQLAPGAQYNKLISFPFSLGPSDDKDGRLRLHIPYMKQHVKRMSSSADTQPIVASVPSQQQPQQQSQQQQSSPIQQQTSNTSGLSNKTTV
ncbi:Glutamate--cysteine ligase regulatory subunit [Fragariocoptes setiger]|uniref:GCS light chain n=1 Tax=Fragariocoptes setiger TaxID=1670756 RepID=A0ABQ7S7E4_9ACAR|nr:Glutamate--cysteine ligase regulatory subunit [Fragariocoptes setiger]